MKENCGNRKTNMRFRTEIQIPPSEHQITHQTKCLFVGSCFAENMSGELEKRKFKVETNPFGILYNPLSVKEGLEILINKRVFTSSDLIKREGLWHSFMHHSRFSGTNKNEVVSKINERISNASEFLRQADYLFITFGTAWVYFLKANKQLVANCHKFPAKVFNRKLLSVETVVEEYIKLFEKLFSFNDKLKIVFTVSPVRHWKDGANGNQISKATLLLGMDKLVNEFPSTSYFPSYELVLDDLRDYRFFEEDLVHPNRLAVNYIFEKFSDVYFSDSTKVLLKKIEKVERGLQHRPFNSKAEEYKKFREKLEQHIQELKNKGIQF